jgi:hypothetical protein
MHTKFQIYNVSSVRHVEGIERTNTGNEYVIKANGLRKTKVRTKAHLDNISWAIPSALHNYRLATIPLWYLFGFNGRHSKLCIAALLERVQGNQLITNHYRRIPTEQPIVGKSRCKWLLPETVYVK